MLDFLNALLFRIQNVAEVLPKEISEFNLEAIISVAITFAIFYYLSKWAKPYIIRLSLLLLGLYLLWQVSGRTHMTNSIDLYVGLAFTIPHLEIIEITYLILREKAFAIYYRIISFLELLISPFVWLYTKLSYFYKFIKAKHEYRQYKKSFKENTNNDNFDDDFRQRAWEEYQKEQDRKDEYERKEQEENRKNYEEFKKEQNEKARQEYKRKQKENSKREEENRHPRWDSLDPYVVLGINPDASAHDIKKAYRNLSKIYHPDLTMTNKEEHHKIFQKINSAYDELK